MSRGLSKRQRRVRASLSRDERGATLVEFALILAPLLFAVLGTMEIGYRIYALSCTNGAIREAARMASTGQYTGAQIDAKVKEMIKSFSAGATVAIDKKSYSDYTGVNLPEPVVSGSRSTGKYCYEDINGNTKWDEDRGKDGLGGPEDVINYEVTITYGTLFGFSQNMLGYGATTTIEQNTIVSNEPFAAVVDVEPATICVGGAVAP